MNKITASVTLWAALCLMPAFSLAATCPAISDVVRIQGSNNWKVINDDNWAAYFMAPTRGMGYSTKVTDFTQTRWIQFNNLPESGGYIECDYSGNYGNEMIRVTQKDHEAVARPTNINWNYTLRRTYPSVASTCAASQEGCPFK
jgi:hypothetical protein